MITGKTIEVSEHGFTLMRERFAKDVSEKFSDQEIKEYWYAYSLLHFTEIMEADWDIAIKLTNACKYLKRCRINEANNQRV